MTLSTKPDARKELQELVACKDLKERIDWIERECERSGRGISATEYYEEWRAAREDYDRRQPLAWAAARAALSAPSEEGIPRERLVAAIELIWSIDVRKRVHLGYERASGLEQNCIACICALALGRSMDGDATEQEFQEQRARLLERDIAVTALPAPPADAAQRKCVDCGAPEGDYRPCYTENGFKTHTYPPADAEKKI